MQVWRAMSQPRFNPTLVRLRQEQTHVVVLRAFVSIPRWFD